MTELRQPLALLACISVLTSAPFAAAQSTQAAEPEESMEAIEARKLFLEGRELLEKRQLSAACDALERSQKLVPTIGTLLNLGMCHSSAGHLATAHNYYRQAEVLATLKQDTRRQEFAHDEAAKLAARRGSLALKISASPDAHLDVRVDNVAQPREVWSNPMYMDAGEHWISVEYRRSADAVESEKWSASITITDGTQHVMVTPEFGGNEGTARPTAPDHTELRPPAAPIGLATAAESGGAAEHDGVFNTRRIIAVSVGAAGIVALGASLAYGIAARNAYNDSKAGCRETDEPQDRCNERGLRLRNDAFAHATRANVFGIAGGVALAGGVVLWLLSSAPEAPEDTSARGPLTISATGDAFTAQLTRTF